MDARNGLYSLACTTINAMDGDTYLGLKVRCVEVISWGNMLLYYHGYNIIHIGKQQTVPGLEIKRSSTNQIKTMTNFRLLYS